MFELGSHESGLIRAATRRCVVRLLTPNPNRAQLVVLTASLLVGLWFIGPRNVWPTSTDWLSYGDMRISQYAWQYFRNTPILQWPPTAMDQYGTDWGTVFPAVSGNVLAGLPFKLLSPLLPSEFQYLGMWTLSCFILQGFFAEKILGHFGLLTHERILGSLSVVVAPALIYRLVMSHLDLGAHWTILAGLYLYWASEFATRTRIWTVLLGATLCIHMYLFVMVFAIALAAAIKDGLPSKDRTPLSTLVRQFSLVAVILGVVWWLLGYAALLGSARGVGFFRLNAFAFINPGGGPSSEFSLLIDRVPWMRERSFFAEEGEGFAYLGAIGLLGVIALIAIISSRARITRARMHMPLLGVAVTLFAAALSNRVAIVRREVTFPIPQALVDARQVFRVANRFSWVLYYILLLLGWVALVRAVRRFRGAPWLLTAIFIVGVVDQSEGILASRDELQGGIAASEPEWFSIVEANAPNISRMYLVPTFDVQSDDLPPGGTAWLDRGLWRELIEFGADRNLTTNFAYLGRPVTRQVESSNAEIRRLISVQDVPSDSVMFFADPNEWDQAHAALGGRAAKLSIGALHILITKSSSNDD